jgi:hypothetical protein
MLQRLTGAFVDGLAARRPTGAVKSRKVAGGKDTGGGRGSGISGSRSLRSLLFDALDEAVPEVDPQSFQVRVGEDGWVSLVHDGVDEDTLSLAEEIVNEVLLSPHIYGADGSAEAELPDPAVPTMVSRMETVYELEELRFAFDYNGRVRLFHDILDRTTLRDLENQLHDWRLMLGTREA